MSRFMEPEQKIESYDGGIIGTPTGSEHRCQLEGCNGVRIATRWTDGRISYPCSRGLIAGADGNMRIG